MNDREKVSILHFCVESESTKTHTGQLKRSRPGTAHE